LIMSQQVSAKLAAYPDNIRPLIFRLREIIFDVAIQLELGEVEESLKWGELSYSVNMGSPIRIDWKESSPDKYFLFFHCQTKLVDTFRELYANELEFEGNRAIILTVGQPLPDRALRHCIGLAMQYKTIKHLPMLGV